MAAPAKRWRFSLMGTSGAILVTILSMLLYFVMWPPPYLFTPQIMAAIARQAIREGAEGGGLNTTISSVVRQLNGRYPGRILKNPPWMFNNAGGAMGAMLVLHCSLVEYVIIFGTAVGTEGHTYVFERIFA